MKRIFYILLIFCFLMSFEGCNSKTIDPSKKKEILVYYYKQSAAASTDDIYLKEGEKIFEEKNKNISIKLKPYIPGASSMSYSETISQLTNSGEKADVFISYNADDLDYVMDGSVISLNNLIEKDKKYFDGIFFDGLLDKVKIKGEIYTLPIATQTWAMYYNKDIIKKYNINMKTDWTWNDFYNICRKISQGGDKIFPYSYKDNFRLVPHYSNSLGVFLLNKSLDKCNLTQPEILKGVNFEKKIMDLDAYDSIPTTDFGYLNQGAYTFYLQPTNISMYKSLQNFGASIDLINLPLDNNDGCFSGYYLYGCISSQSLLQKESFEFLKTLVSEDVQEKHTMANPINQNAFMSMIKNYSKEKQNMLELITEKTSFFNMNSRAIKSLTFISDSLNNKLQNKEEITDSYLKDLNNQAEQFLNKKN